MSIKKNNAYYEENGKIYYYDDAGVREAVPDSAFGNTAEKLDNLYSNSDCVYIDPENGDDTKDGLTKNTAVKNLERASEVYVSKFGGRIVKACLINTHTCERGTQPNPGNTSNLFLPDLDGIDSVYLFGDNGICISNCDYQNEPGPKYSTKSIPTYELHLKFEYEVGVWLYRMPTSSAYGDAYSNVIDVESISGDVALSGGSYGQTLKKVRVIAKNGRIWWNLSPEFNTYSNVTTEYEFESLGFTETAPICGKQIKITSQYDGMNNSEVNSIYNGLWCKGDIYIKSIGTLSIYGQIFCSGRINLSSVESAIRTYDNPTVTFYSTIMGRGNDDESYYGSDPSRSTYPEINIDWAGTVLLSGAHCNNLNVKAWKFALYSTSPILSQRDIIIYAEYINLYNYSTSNFWHCLGKMIFRSPNEIKIAQYLNTDELVIDAGGRPNDYPINYSDYKYPYWSTTGVTGTSDVHCKITNLFECILGGADPILSTDEAHYFVKCSGDYADQWSTFGNGNAIVSLDVGGHAYLSGNGAMIVKRFTLKSKSAFITNSGIYASSFDIRTGQLFWNNSGYLNQWVNYSSGWSISQNRSYDTSWSNDFEDRSSLNCDSLEQLTSTTSGFVHPGYGQKRHDWDINIKVLVPYRRVANYYGGGPEYAVVLGYINQGTFNGSIAGEIGDVLVTDQKQSPYSHDWIFPSYYQGYYENNKFGNNVTLHIAHRKWHHVYIDMDQGSDAYDGMSKETPVKSTYGLDKVFKQMLYPTYITIHICGSNGNGNRGNTQTQYGPYNSIDFSYVIKTFEGGLLYNWYAAYYLSQHLSDVGIPTGWRVPTRSDFTTLRNTGNNEYLRFRVPDLTGTDQYGFSDIGQKGYYVGNDGVFGWSINPSYWTSEEKDTNYAYYSGIQDTSYTSKYNLCPMRLVRDNTEGYETGTTGTVEIGGTTYNTVVIGAQVWITKNLDFKFSDGTFRDSLSSNHFDQSSTPQYGYYNYGNNSVPYSMNDNPVYSMPYLLTIVADDPYLSATVKGPIQGWNNTPGMLKMYGFHTLNVLDCFAWVTDLQASVDLYYVAYSSSQSNYPKTNVLRLRGGNVYTMGIAAGYNTAIEADNNYRCLSGTNNTGSGNNTPGFYGVTYIHAKYIDFTGNQCTFASGICGSLIADAGFRFGTPIKFEYGSLSIIANGSGNISDSNLPDGSNTSRCYFSISPWYGIGNISLICPNQDLYVYTWGQSERTNGRLIVEANTLMSYGNLYGCDIDIHTKNNTQFYGSILGEGGRSSLVRLDCGGELSGAISTRCCNMKISARKLINPITIVNDSNVTFDTNIYVNTEYAANGVFSIDNPIDSNYNLFARVVELAGPFYVYNGTPPLTNGGSYIKKFKGLVSFYIGSVPDTDLADFTEIAPNADFELIVLNRSKQLVAGNGISISDTGDNVVIASETQLVEIPVVVDTLDDTQCSATLVLNKYNVITGLDEYVTDMDIIIPSAGQSVLREVGFEFAPVSGNSLSAVNFYGEGGIPLFEITPEEYYYGCMYQGAAVNRCVTLVEYGEPVEPEPEGLVIDGRTYSIAEMPDGSVWMAENLAADSFGGVCFNGGTDDSYGLYYTETELHNISVPGWHIPTSAEVQSLISSVNGTVSKLTSTTEWTYTNGTDDYGINFKPYGGCQFMDNEWSWIPPGGAFVIWIAPENGDDYQFGIFDWDGSGYQYSTMPALANVFKVPVRLVKDAE